MIATIFGERLELTVNDLVEALERGVNVYVWADAQGVGPVPQSALDRVSKARLEAETRFEAERRRIDRDLPWAVETWEERERLRAVNIARYEADLEAARRLRKVVEAEHIVNTLASRSRSQSRRAA